MQGVPHPNPHFVTQARAGIARMRMCVHIIRRAGGGASGGVLMGAGKAWVGAG